MAPAEEFNSLNGSHDSGRGGSAAVAGANAKSNSIVFDTTKNEMFKLSDNFKTLQRKLKVCKRHHVVRAKIYIYICFCFTRATGRSRVTARTAASPTRASLRVASLSSPDRERSLRKTR
jgi:hypothetical protein